MTKRIKIFEIPIYAFSKDELLNKFENKKRDILNENYNLSQTTKNAVIELETYPARVWEYNHIIGYLVIYVSQQDIIFEVFKPHKLKRYNWNSKKKLFLLNTHQNGLHFRLAKDQNLDVIQKDVEDMLFNIVDENFRSRYVDLDMFLRINKYINYLEISDGINTSID